MKTAGARLSPDEFEAALITPSDVFDTPSEVVKIDGLSREQRIDILKRWELDARSLQRASDESMGGGEPPLLDEVNKALLELDPKGQISDQFGKAPTKI